MKDQGRPPKDCDIRDTRVVIYMTREDALYLNELTKNLGFKGRSEMIVALLERLIIGGFSALGFFKLGVQFANRIAESPACKQAGMYFGTRPLPSLPVEDAPSNDELVAEFEKLKQETQTT